MVYSSWRCFAFFDTFHSDVGLRTVQKIIEEDYEDYEDCEDCQNLSRFDDLCFVLSDKMVIFVANHKKNKTMKKNEKSRIAAFIESLPPSEGLENCESTLLATDLGLEGEGKNGGNCINASADCMGSENGGSCKNFGGKCGNSTNKKDCVITDLEYQIPSCP